MKSEVSKECCSENCTTSRCRARRFSMSLLVWIAVSSMHFHAILADEEILLDTRTALSDLGWVMSPESKWQEMSSNDADGEERRMFMVCEIKQRSKQDNWLRTQYIPVNGARRVYVEVEFSIRSCEGVENVASCKETFNLYYYETDRDEATSTFPPWSEESYTKVDTIAADQRFSPGSDDTNFEVRDIGPISKRGVYLAIQDTGACVAIMHVRVYYKYCARETKNLATFGRTIAGPEMTSLVETRGVCVGNAVTERSAFPSLYCNGKGNWTVPSGACACLPGYQPDTGFKRCNACQNGQFKSTAGNRLCERCPAYSLAGQRGLTQCDCMRGYFRTASDGAESPCTKPPTKPVNADPVVNETSVFIKWGRPQHDGGREDLSYSIKCRRCRQPGYKSCGECSDNVVYYPSRTSIDQNQPQVTIQRLHAHSEYQFLVYAINGVTDIAESAGTELSNYVEVNVVTNQAQPSAVLGVRQTDVRHDGFTVTWDVPGSPNGLIVEYEVRIGVTSSAAAADDVITSSSYVNRTAAQRITYTALRSSTTYQVEVRARTRAGFGPFSRAIGVTTQPRQSNAELAPLDADGAAHGSGVDVVLLVCAMGGVVVFVAIIVAVAIIVRRRSRPRKSTLGRGGGGGVGVDAEKQPFFNGSAVVFGGMYPGHAGCNHKTYIDPTTYEDPNRAVRDFTKEIDSACVKIEEVIGGGEFGEVCRGRMQLPGKSEQDVAIKTLKAGYSTQQKLDFLGEASIMGQFDHPNVIRLEGVATKSRPLMIITEFMENGSLDAFLRNRDGQFSVIQLVGMLRNIAAGMKYLADMGYVHRDLAARNILVNAQLICKVSDFGMSRVLEDDTDAAYTARGGKIPIRWTAPEAFTFRKFTSASDVWSFGIVMWEVMSYGERPYWGMSNRDVMNAVETGYRLPAPMDCPQVQHALMLECWKKDRNKRPKFAQLVAGLDKMLRDPAQLKVKAGHQRTGTCNPAIANRPPVSGACPPTTSAPADSGFNDESDDDEPIAASSSMTSSRGDAAVDTSSLGAWLGSVGLCNYKELFTLNGYSSAEQVVKLTRSDLTRIGITDEQDQERVLDSLRVLGEAPTEISSEPPALLPSYSESNRLNTGISV